MSYDPTLPSDRDWIRFWIGDTVTTAHVLQDTEIDALLLAEDGNKYLAAYTAGMVIYSKRGGLVEKQVGDLRLRWSESAGKAYLHHLMLLRERGLSGSTQTEFRAV